MNERDLGVRVVDWLVFQHWDVYQEVMLNSTRADIVAVRDGKVWVIECKTSLTIKVLEQAHAWRAHFRSVAVPQTTNGGYGSGRSFAYQLCNMLQIGALEINGMQVHQVKSPPLMREYHKHSKWMIDHLKEEHKTSLMAGSNGGGYYTPYKGTIDVVRHFIQAHPGCTLKEIMVDLTGQHHYASDQSARSSICKSLETFERTWCEVKYDGKVNRYFIRTKES